MTKTIYFCGEGHKFATTKKSEALAHSEKYGCNMTDTSGRILMEGFSVTKRVEALVAEWQYFDALDLYMSKRREEIDSKRQEFVIRVSELTQEEKKDYSRTVYRLMMKGKTRA
jgi:hypothetical protein